MSEAHAQKLSVIVAIVSDTVEKRAGVEALKQSLEALEAQEDAPELEIIVPYHDAVDGLDDLREQFPNIRFVDTKLELSKRKGAGREHHDVLRACGLAVITGDLVCLIEDHALPDPKWCANIVKAHSQPHAAIGGAIENGIDRPLNWAVYFCDYGKYQNPIPEGESYFASDSNVSYKTNKLESVRSTWEQAFQEVVVNGALRDQGDKVYLQPDIIVYQNRYRLKFGEAMRERYIWGRSYAATRNQLIGLPKRLIYAALCPILPLVLIRRIAMTAFQRKHNFKKFLRSMHLIAMLQASWSIGECIGYLTGIRE